MRNVVIIASIITLFLLTRWYILTNPPYKEATTSKPSYGYSDVKHDSERYANMWHYGLTPYREHMYEYPPIAIPFVYLPLLADINGIGHYYPNYRFEIFLFEVVLFCLLIKATGKIWQNQPHRQWLALIFYCLIGAIGKDFWYDGLDLLFIGFFSLALITRYLTGSQKMWHRIVFWALFSVSFGIKYMTLPLALPLFWLNRKKWKQELIAGIVGFSLVWGIPIMLYRSSLSVMVLFHTARPFNYGSLGRWVVQAVNDFTHTETQTDILPHLPIVGPVAQSTEKIFSILFVAAALSTVGWSTWKAHLAASKFNREQELRFSIVITLLFFMSIFVTNKVFSNPFHIWYIPLITLLPLGSLFEQLLLMTGGIVMFILDTTAWIRVSEAPVVGPISLSRIRGIVRFIPMFAFLGFSIKELNRKK